MATNSAETKVGETKPGETKAGETKAKVATSPRPLNWSTMRLLTTLFAVWFMGTLVSAWLYRRPNFSFGVLWQIFRDRNKPNQPQLDHQLLALQPHSLDADKLLVMRPLGDEANMSLVVSQSLSYMQNKLLSFLQGFQDGFLGRSSFSAAPASNMEEAKPKRRSGCLMSMLKLAGLVGLLIGVSELTVKNSAEEYAIGTISDAIDNAMPGSWLQKLPLLIPMILFVSLLAFFVIYGFLSLFALIGLLLSAAPFGLDAMFWNHFTSTTAEPAPVGTSPAHIFHAAPKDGSVDPGLAHSGIYTNPEATRQIVSWIKSLDLSEKGSTTNEVC